MTLRLLRVVVQAVLVEDDGALGAEQTCEPITLSASEWPAFASTGFSQALSRLIGPAPDVEDGDEGGLSPR